MATTTKKYKLIKEYPGSLPIDTIIELRPTSTSTYNVIIKGLKNQCKILFPSPEYYPEFWQQIKEPLFYTEDGVAIYEDDKYYYVNLKDFDMFFIASASSDSGKDTDFKYFSTKEAAEKFVDYMKPRYSKQDLERILIRSNNYNTPCDDKLMACKLMIIATRDLINEMLKEE